VRGSGTIADNLASKVFLIGEKPSQNLSSILQFYSRISDLPLKNQTPIDVLILPLLVALSDEASKHIHIIHARNPSLQLILIAPQGSAVRDLEDCINKFPIAQIIESVDTMELEGAILIALEETQKLRQNQQLESLVREQSEKLRNMHKELEERVEKRQSFLIEARAKTLQANARWEAVLKATEIIQQAESLGEIESLLTKILSADMNLFSTRIYFQPQDDMFKEQQKGQKNHSFYRASLSRGEDEASIGSIFFIRSQDLTFRRDETDFLQKIAEVVSLAIDRLDKLKQTVSFKEHWEATFNAVAEPVIILNQKFEVLQSNSSFQKRIARSAAAKETEVKKCYESLFQRKTPCENCHLGSKFRVENKGRETSTFEVYSQPLPSTPDEQKLFVNQYHDITEQLKMERKIVESARLAEIGTIGSSIAHELNNPLGGMLSFAQLIQLDLAKDHPLHADVVELENGIRRCKDIVQNLLGFTRNPGAEDFRQLDLREVVDRALKIIELQSRSMGVEIKIKQPTTPVLIEGYFNHLSQAVQNVLYSSLQSISEMNQPTRSHALIEIQLIESTDLVFMKILDNGPGAENPVGLGVSLSEQILHEHGGKLEFSQDSKPFRMAKISLPRLISTHQKSDF
jgi:nitrogen-specific signal transduction histidine kinase